jgi:hypothetical protein
MSMENEPKLVLYSQKCERSLNEGLDDFPSGPGPYLS